MRKFILLLAWLCAPAAYSQTLQNPLQGPISAASSTCAQGAVTCVWMKLAPNQGTMALTITGTFSATLVVEQSSDNGITFTTVSTLSAPATATQFSISGMTDFRVRCSAYVSGSAFVTLQSSTASTGGGGTTSPSSLTTFFNKYYGLSPVDYGAKGDTHVFYDCGMSTNNHVTCGTGHFVSTDVGKWLESCAANCSIGTTAPTINAGLITVFNSATDVTVSVTAGTTYSNTRTAFGSDDDAAMQAWAAAMVQAPVNGNPPLTRGGYLPQGGFAIKQPISIVYPNCTTPGVCNSGEGGPNTLATGDLRPSLWLAGQGSASSFIYVRTAGQFTWPTQASDSSVLLIKDFDFSSLTNFAILGDGSTHVTTGITTPGVVSFLENSNSTHAMWSGLWVQGFHNSSNKACGFVTSGNDFESTYSYMAIESHDINGCVGASMFGANQTMEKIRFETDFFENPIQGQNVQIGDPFFVRTLTLKQIGFSNCHSLNGKVASINFLNNVATSNGETVQLVSFRQEATTVVAGGLGIVTNTTTGLNVDCHGCYLADTSGAAGNFIVDNTSANATFNFYGGAFQGAGLTNLFNNVGNIFVYGTKIQGGPSVSAIQTGAGNTYGYFPVAGSSGGWNGRGVIQSTAYIANQGTLPIIANFVLSAGWGNTAAVTGVSGGIQGLRFTVTASGTGQGANPTITWTLPAGAALPSSTVNCHLDQTGGTGAFTMITQTTQSATVPIFTLQGTPTAAATYIYEGGCGR